MMPKLEEHIKKSLERTGKEWRNVHEFLDGQHLSVLEKLRRHSPLVAVRNFGEIEKDSGQEGIREYVHHLKEDYRKFRLMVLWRLFERKIGKSSHVNMEVS